MGLKRHSDFDDSTIGLVTVTLPSGRQVIVRHPGTRVEIYQQWCRESPDLIDIQATASTLESFNPTQAHLHAALALIKKILADHIVEGLDYAGLSGHVNDIWFLFAHSFGADPQIEDFASADNPAAVAGFLCNFLLLMAKGGSIGGGSLN